MIFFQRYCPKDQDLDPLRDCFSDSSHSDPMSSWGDAQSMNDELLHNCLLIIED